MKGGKGILIAIAGVLVIGAVIYYFAVVRKKNGDAEKIATDQTEPPMAPPTEPGVDMPEPTTTEPTETVDSKLDWVKQKAVAEYLTTILSASAMDELKGWVKLIEQQREEDPKKWAEGNGGLYGQVSNIAHGLYQMDVWNNDILQNLKAKQ